MNKMSLFKFPINSDESTRFQDLKKQQHKEAVPNHILSQVRTNG